MLLHLSSTVTENVQVAKTTSHDQLTFEILFVSQDIKFISLSQHVMILYILLYAKTTTTSELEQFSVDFTSLLLATFQLRFDKVWLPCNALARNDVITILTSEDMENMP